MKALIVAIDKNGGIGKNNTIPWHISEDLKMFKSLTLNSSIIMGRKTWESIGSKPLPKRQNLVLGKEFISGMNEALEKCENDNVFFIGGSAIYNVALDLSDKAYVTEVDADFDCDVFFPLEKLKKMFVIESATDWCNSIDKNGNTLRYRTVVYVKQNETRNV